MQLLKKTMGIIISGILFHSCGTSGFSVPEEFKNHSENYRVIGVTGWMKNQELSFGPYRASKIKRGWNFHDILLNAPSNFLPEKILQKVFDQNTADYNADSCCSFHYSLKNNDQFSEIYATEKFTEEQLAYKSNNPYINGASATAKYAYAFAAVILPLTEQEEDPWLLVLINKYDLQNNKSENLSPKSYVEAEGYATDGKNNIAIRPLRTGTAGRAGQLVTGYELQYNGKAIIMLDMLHDRIWIHHETDPAINMIASSIASAIFLKHTRDVEKNIQ